MKISEPGLLRTEFPRQAKVLPSSLATLALSVALSACAGKHPQEQLPPTPPPTIGATRSTTPAPVAVQVQPGSQADFVATMMGRDTIHFAFDKSDIDPAAVEALTAQAHWLMRYPFKRATIEGNCDERGTRDYNLALGQRRAVAAKNFLIRLGIDAGRINVISYGKERPIDTASTEAAWAKNRRAVTMTID